MTIRPLTAASSAVPSKASPIPLWRTANENREYSPRPMSLFPRRAPSFRSRLTCRHQCAVRPATYEQSPIHHFRTCCNRDHPRTALQSNNFMSLPREMRLSISYNHV